MARRDRNTPLFMIGVAAELAGVHPQTLRIYESKGLIRPQRSGGNTRLYSQADIERLELIGRLTSEGINLAGVTRILKLRESLEEADQTIAMLEKRVMKLEMKVRQAEMRENLEIQPYRRGTLMRRNTYR